MSRYRLDRLKFERVIIALTKKIYSLPTAINLSSQIGACYIFSNHPVIIIVIGDAIRKLECVDLQRRLPALLDK